MRAEHVGFADVPGQLGFVHGFERLAGQDATCVQSRLTRDGGRGFGVVARDHHDPNAGRPAFLHRRGGAGPQGIGEADKPDEFEGEFARRSRQVAAPADGSRDAENPKPVGRHIGDGLFQGVEARAAETAAFRDRFGRAFRGDLELRTAGRRPPDLGHGEQIGAKPIDMDELEATVVGSRRFPRAFAAQFVKRLLHGVERLASACENADADEVPECVGN